jgi:hypothetical protein
MFRQPIFGRVAFLASEAADLHDFNEALLLELV